MIVSLTWHDHIDYICGKISKNMNIMVKLKHYVSKATLISVYYSLIYPYLTYACTLWGNNQYLDLAKPKSGALISLVFSTGCRRVSSMD